MRLLAGFCFSGLYIVAESWLNGSASNESRASLLSVYFIIQTGGVMIGQLLLNLSSPDGILLFIIISILISFSLVPMLISTSSTPPYELPERISLAELFRLSPMGLSGSFVQPDGVSVMKINPIYGNVDNSGIDMYFSEGYEPIEDKSNLQALKANSGFRAVFD